MVHQTRDAFGDNDDTEETLGELVGLEPDRPMTIGAFDRTILALEQSIELITLIDPTDAAVAQRVCLAMARGCGGDFPRAKAELSDLLTSADRVRTPPRTEGASSPSPDGPLVTPGQ